MNVYQTASALIAESEFCHGRQNRPPFKLHNIKLSVTLPNEHILKDALQHVCRKAKVQAEYNFDDLDVVEKSDVDAHSYHDKEEEVCIVDYGSFCVVRQFGSPRGGPVFTCFPKCGFLNVTAITSGAHLMESIEWFYKVILLKSATWDQLCCIAQGVHECSEDERCEFEGTFDTFDELLTLAAHEMMLRSKVRIDNLTITSNWHQMVNANVNSHTPSLVELESICRLLPIFESVRYNNQKFPALLLQLGKKKQRKAKNKTCVEDEHAFEYVINNTHFNCMLMLFCSGKILIVGVKSLPQAAYALELLNHMVFSMLNQCQPNYSSSEEEEEEEEEEASRLGCDIENERLFGNESDVECACVHTKEGEGKLHMCETRV